MNELSEQDVLLAETIMKMAAIERLLIKSKILIADDITAEMKLISEEVMKALKINMANKN